MRINNLRPVPPCPPDDSLTQRADDVADTVAVAFTGTRSAPLAAEAFSALVANAPLVAIDLIVEDAEGKALLGLRTNPPAQGCWFVPGGRIRKNETLDQAFARISGDELGTSMSRSAARLVGVFEHFYDIDFSGAAGSTTHYVVLAYRLQLTQPLVDLPHGQHSRYQWMPPHQITQHPHVHLYTQAYFSELT